VKKKFNIKTKLVAAARKLWQYHPVRTEVFVRALAQKRVNTRDNVYKCEKCGFKGIRGEFAVDHIDPVVDPYVGFIGWSEETGFSGWDNFYNRLLTTADKLMLMCNPCHSIKTEFERGIRKITKKTIDKNKSLKLKYIKEKSNVNKSKNSRSKTTPRKSRKKA